MFDTPPVAPPLVFGHVSLVFHPPWLFTALPCAEYAFVCVFFGVRLPPLYLPHGVVAVAEYFDPTLDESHAYCLGVLPSPKGCVELFWSLWQPRQCWFIPNICALEPSALYCTAVTPGVYV